VHFWRQFLVVAERVVTMEGVPAPVEANERIRDWARRAAPRDDSKWEFVCECGEPGCTDHVEMTLALFDQARRAHADVLARGHTRKRAEATRRQSAEVRQEAEAVRNQALHQIRRTENLRSARFGPYPELICDECGYGVCVPEPPTTCPMCRSTAWHVRPRGGAALNDPERPVALLV
jgi:rubrerythrin